MKILNRKKNRGQTALEYALVVGVLAVGIIAVSKFLFEGKQDSPVGKLFGSAVGAAQEQVTGKE